MRGEIAPVFGRLFDERFRSAAAGVHAYWPVRLTLAGVICGFLGLGAGWTAAVMWFGAALAILSGLGLLVGYPAKALTNWIFGLKFVCLIGAALLVRQIGHDAFPPAARGEPVPDRAKWLAAAALVLWLGGIACGKLLLYTNHVLFSTDEWVP